MKIGQLIAIAALILSVSTIIWICNTSISRDQLPPREVVLQPIDSTENSIRYAGVQASKIYVSLAQRVVLDPDFEGVELVGGYRRRFEVKKNRSTLFIHDGGSRPDTIAPAGHYIRIGLKNVRPDNNLDINLGQVKHVTASKTLKFGRITCDIGEADTTVLDIDCDVILFNLINLAHKAEKHHVTIKGQTNLFFMGMNKELDLDLRNLKINDFHTKTKPQNSVIQFGEPELVNIRLDTSTKVSFLKEPKYKMVKVIGFNTFY
jgi:hypothetical protein